MSPEPRSPTAAAAAAATIRRSFDITFDDDGDASSPSGHTESTMEAEAKEPAQQTPNGFAGLLIESDSDSED